MLNGNRISISRFLGWSAALDELDLEFFELFRRNLVIAGFEMVNHLDRSCQGMVVSGHGFDS